MSEESNVTPINGGTPSRPPKQFEMPKPVNQALHEHSRRVYAARAIALLAFEKIGGQCGSMPIDKCEQLEFVLEGIAELLRPINNLTDSVALMRRGKEILGEEVAND